MEFFGEIQLSSEKTTKLGMHLYYTRLSYSLLLNSDEKQKLVKSIQSKYPVHKILSKDSNLKTNSDIEVYISIGKDYELELDIKAFKAFGSFISFREQKYLVNVFVNGEEAENIGTEIIEFINNNPYVNNSLESIV